MATHAAELNSFHRARQASGQANGLRASLARWAEAFFQSMEDHANRTPFARRIRELEAKSDAELAELGLTRTQIPQAALGSVYHI